MTGSKPLKIGFNPDFAPFSYMESGKPAGIIIDRICDIMNDAKLPYQFIPVGLMDLTEGLKNGDFDILAAMASTADRLKIMAFSKPVIVSGGAWFIPVDLNPGDGDKVPDIVITPKTGPLVSQISALYPEIKVITCDDYDDALRLTLLGNFNAEAAALNWHVGRMMVEGEKYNGLFHIPKAPFKSIPLYMAVTREDPHKIIEGLNDHIPDDWGPDPL